MEAPDDLDKLLTDVRKTISDNRLFLVKLADDEIETETDGEEETVTGEGDFEEL